MVYLSRNFRSFCCAINEIILPEHHNPNHKVMAKLLSPSNIYKLNFINYNNFVDIAVKELTQNNIVAIPTDTIYGIACVINNDEAIKKLYDIKNRQINKPISMCCSTLDELKTYAFVTISDKLLNQLLPGPVTLIFQRKLLLNKNFNPENNFVGLRIPNNGFVIDICRRLGSPIALTSANLSNEPSSLSINEFHEIWHKLSAIFDGGLLNDNQEARLGSTVVDLSYIGHFKIIRNGSAYNSTVKILEDFGLKTI